MSENILINDNLDKLDDDLLPFPRSFAECVADILASTDNKERTNREPYTGRTFVSSAGLIFR